MSKIEEAREILKELQVPAKQQADLCGYVLLAMADIKEDDEWSSAVNTWNSTRKTNAPTKTKKHPVANLPKRQTQCRACGRPVGNQYAWQCKNPTFY